jgi:hypothetical protein
MEDVVTQIGLMLTRLDAMRRAVEEIARNSSRYTSLAFAEAFTTTSGAGAPPLRNGALMVHVINIRDLAQSGGLGGFFEGLLGGIGRLIGGAVGGFVGGTIAGVALPVMIGQLAGIVRRVERLVDRFGLGERAARGAAAQAGTTASTPPREDASLTETLTDATTTMDLITGLLTAAALGPETAGQSSATSITPAGERWLAILQTVQGVVAGIDRIVRGLTLLIPLLVGSLALLVDRLADIRLAIVEVLQFVVRNALILRGTVFVVIYDLLALVARLASSVLTIAGATVRGVLTGVFDIAASVLSGGLAVFRFLAGGIQRTVTALLRWMTGTLFSVLIALGDLRVFRVITHLVRILPAVMIPLHELLRDSSTPSLTPAERLNLTRAFAMGATLGPSTGAAATVPAIPAAPNIALTLIPAAEERELRRALGEARGGVIRGVTGIEGAAQRGLTGVSDELGRAASRELTLSQTTLAGNLGRVREQSEVFAGAMRDAQIAASQRPETGLETIARAYERWLTGDGLRQVLSNLTQLFRETPPSDAGSLPGAVVQGAIDRPRASVDIQDVVIDVSETGRAAAEGLTDEQAESLYENFIDWLDRRELRSGGAPAARPAP